MLILGLIFSTLIASANTCTEVYEQYESLNFYRQPLSSGSCVMSASPVSSEGLVYRSFFFDERGLMMVFNSFGDGPVSKDTGARIFFFFPRTVIPSFAASGDHTLLTVANESLQLSFDNKTGRLVGTSWGTAKEDPSVNPKNNGGVELTINKGLLLDSGWATGKDPRTNPSDKSTFIDAKGKSCKLANKEIFLYEADGDVNLAKTDAEIKSLLAAKCPKLSAGF